MLVRVLSMPARGRPTASQWPVTRAPQKHFDVQARVAVCEHVRWWRGSHTRAACVSSVFWTRVIVCEAQSSERERGTRDRGSGRPGAPTCLFVGKWESVTRFATELCLPVEKADIAPPSNASKQASKQVYSLLALQCPPTTPQQLRGLFSVLLLSVLLRVLCCNHRNDMGRKKMTPFAKAKKLQNRMEASLPSALKEEIGTPAASFATQHSHAAHSVNRVTYPVQARQHRSRWSSYVHGTINWKAEIGDRRGPAHPRLADHAEQRAEHTQQRPEATAPPVSLRQDDVHASAASAEDHTEQRAKHAQRPEATAPPAAEDSKRALVRELQKDLSRMSLLLERLDELLSA